VSHAADPRTDSPDGCGNLVERCAAELRRSSQHRAVTVISAAQIHGMWLPPMPGASIELTAHTPDRLPPGMNRAKRGAVRAHRRRIAPSDLTVVHSIPVTSLALTWRDLAAVLPLPDLVAAGDSALQLGATMAQLIDICNRMRGRRGARAAATALSLLDPRSRSRPESHLRVALTSTGLMMFDVNVAVHTQYGEWLAEPDLSCAAAKIALEYQGADHADVKRMRKDITRAADLRRAGWLVLLFGPAEVFGRPWQIAPEVRYLIGQRAHQLLAPDRRTVGE
jgi:very-short-patch-repair endonuclease